MIIKAIIPARSGSQRCIDKNIKKFCDSSLIEIKIKQLQKCNKIDSIIINSNDNKILSIASKYDKVELVKRDNYYASSDISINKVYKNIAENFNGDLMVYCNCTNPMIDQDIINNCIDIYLNMDQNRYQSVNTCIKLKNFIWYKSNPLNYEYDKMPRSQDLPEYLSPNFAVNIISKKYVLENSQIISKNPYFYIVDNIKGYDIDDEIDFKIAEQLFKL